MSRKTYTQLVTENTVLKSQLPYNLKDAYQKLELCDVSRFMASGVIVTITDLKGAVVAPSFMCVDGLETDTITALRGQIKKTQNLQSIGA